MKVRKTVTRSVDGDENERQVVADVNVAAASNAGRQGLARGVTSLQRIVVRHRGRRAKAVRAAESESEDT